MWGSGLLGHFLLPSPEILRGSRDCLKDCWHCTVAFKTLCYQLQLEGFGRLRGTGDDEHEGGLEVNMSNF